LYFDSRLSGEMLDAEREIVKFYGMKIVFKFNLANCFYPIFNIPGILKSKKMSPRRRFFYLMSIILFFIGCVFIIFFFVLTLLTTT
jgi:hypothetical protein